MNAEMAATANDEDEPESRSGLFVGLLSESFSSILVSASSVPGAGPGVSSGAGDGDSLSWASAGLAPPETDVTSTSTEKAHARSNHHRSGRALSGL